MTVNIVLLFLIMWFISIPFINESLWKWI